jgi:putative nucleotidyltransferase with HDIG domain
VQTPNIRKHLLAAEAIMRALARRLEPGEEERYGLVGLLHDADYEATEKDAARHTDLVAERLARIGAPQEIIDAIRGHCDKAPRTTTMAKAIYACDAMSGLITAAALVRPDKRLAGLTADSILKRFREKSFARGANREEILTCEPELSIPLAAFTELCLEAMNGVAPELGL